MSLDHNPQAEQMGDESIRIEPDYAVWHVPVVSGRRP